MTSKEHFEVNRLEMRARVDEILNRRLAVGFALGVVPHGSLGFAVMQLWEQGLVGLDTPANDYLRAYHPPRCTIHYLAIAMRFGSGFFSGAKCAPRGGS